MRQVSRLPTDSVSFTAQYNEAGKLYVKVFGLGDD